jgi:ABC-type oligopeptide transport system substrate-binding subunit
MNKLLLRLSAGALVLGMLGASACTACSQGSEESTMSSPAMQQQSFTCGYGTHREGNACVANSQPTGGTSTQSNRPTTLNTNNNN